MLRDLFYMLSPDFLGHLYFRLGANILSESKHPIDLDGIRRMCILLPPTSQNRALLSPIAQSLRRAIPNVSITAAIPQEDATDLTDLADKVVILNNSRKLRKIREDWPDLTIAAVPGDYKQAKLAFRTGAMRRLGFRYDHRDKQGAGFFFTHAIPVDEGKSELEQALDLIRYLGIPVVRES